MIGFNYKGIGVSSRPLCKIKKDLFSVLKTESYGVVVGICGKRGVQRRVWRGKGQAFSTYSHRPWLVI